MTKRIIVHAGFPKTGSSALQVQLAQSRDALLTRGLDYLRTGDFALGLQGKISSGNGVNLACAFLPPNHEASKAQQRGPILNKTLETIAASDHDVILSSEFFCAMPVRLLAEMVEALNTVGKVELVYFVRNQMNLLASTYMQRVKRHGLTQYPDEFFENWDHFKPSLQYFSLLQHVQEACPGTTIHAMPYERSKDHPRGLVGLFLDILGVEVPADILAPDRPVNLSPSPKEIRLMLEVNHHHPRMQFSDMLVEASARAGRSKVHADHAILPPAFREAVRAFFREENANFFKTYLGEDVNQYDVAMADESFVDLRSIELTSDDVVHIVAGLLSDMDRRLGQVEAKIAQLGAGAG